jgi:hypothetical protein
LVFVRIRLDLRSAWWFREPGGLASVPFDLSILVGAENLGFAVVPMAILSARFCRTWGVFINVPVTS